MSRKKVDHRVAGRLALSHAYGLDENLVESGGLAEDDGLAGLAGHASQASCRRAGADERVGVYGQLLHARLIAQDAALGALTGRVDGEHGQLAAFLFQQVDAELVDAGRLAGTRHAADADAHTAPAVGQTLLDDLLRLGLMVGVDALDEGDGLREDGDVALQDAFYHIGGAHHLTAEAASLQIRIDDRLLLYAAVYLQTGKFCAILGMFHLFYVDSNDYF